MLLHVLFVILLLLQVICYKLLHMLFANVIMLLQVVFLYYYFSQMSLSSSVKTGLLIILFSLIIHLITDKPVFQHLIQELNSQQLDENTCDNNTFNQLLYPLHQHPEGDQS